MRNKWLWVSLVMVVIVVFVAACAQSPEQITEEVDVEALIVDRCSECHSPDRVFDADYDEQGWSDEIDEMVQKGAEVSDEEKALMIDWLISR